MTRICALLSCEGGRHAAFGLGQEIDWSRGPEQFDAVRAEATANCEAKRTAIKGDRTAEVVYIDVHQELHWMLLASPSMAVTRTSVERDSCSSPTLLRTCEPTTVLHRARREDEMLLRLQSRKRTSQASRKRLPNQEGRG